MCDVRLDLTRQKLTIVPADVLRLGDSLCQLSIVGNLVCELPADLDLCRRLRVLNLAANELSGLPNLSGLKELTHVGLSYNKVSDAGLPALQRCLPACLQSLDLAANELCHLEALLEVFEERLPKLQHASLRANPLAIRVGYKALVACSVFGAHLTLFDGAQISPDMREDAATRDAAAAGSALGGHAAAVDSHADGEIVDNAGEEGAEPEAHAEDNGNDHNVTLRVTIMQLAGVPNAPLPAGGVPGAADSSIAAEGGGEAALDQHIAISFTILGKASCTKALPRAGTVDFEATSVDLCLPRCVQLRDELLVHGVPFDVLAIKPTAVCDSSGEIAAALGAEPAPAARHEVLGTVVTRWEPLACGEPELTQVCSAVVQPPVPTKKSKTRSANAPPPFTLSLTASIAVLS